MGPETTLAVVAVAAFWIIVAAILSLLAARRLRRANAVIGAARSIASLLAVAPARPLIVRTDGGIEPDPILLREIGVEGEPARLGDLAGQSNGLDAADLDALASEVAGAALSGSRIERQVRIAGSGRVLDVRGAPAPAPAPAGTMLVWLFDISDADADRAELARRLQQTEGALDCADPPDRNARPSRCGIAAPTSALGWSTRLRRRGRRRRRRRSHRTRQRADRGCRRGRRPRRRRWSRWKPAKPYSRTQPATIGGERRMLRIVDVPLPTGAVAGFAIDIQDLEDARIELARITRNRSASWPTA